MGLRTGANCWREWIGFCFFLFFGRDGVFVGGMGEGLDCWGENDGVVCVVEIWGFAVMFMLLRSDFDS